MSDLISTRETTTTGQETPGQRVQTSVDPAKTQTQTTTDDEGATITFMVPIVGGLCSETVAPI